MSEEKTARKTHTSTNVKRRYNAKVYATVSAQLPKDLVARFKEKCASEGVSIASVLKKAMQEYLDE